MSDLTPLPSDDRSLTNVAFREYGYGAQVALDIAGVCPHCSSPYSLTIHGGPCPRVKAIEYHPDGTVKRVEFRADEPPLPPMNASSQGSD